MGTSDKKVLADFLGVLAKLDDKERSRVLDAVRGFDYAAIKNASGKELEKIASKTGWFRRY
jgi:hypothetical protein